MCHAGGSVPALSSRQLDELNNVEVLVVDASGGESAARRVARLVQQVGTADSGACGLAAGRRCG